MILERTEIHESGKLADFGAALTTADAQSLQEVLATLNVTERIEKTLLLVSYAGGVDRTPLPSYRCLLTAAFLQLPS